MDEQMRLIDLVPRRLAIIALWLVGGLAVISGLEVLHNWQHEFSAATTGVQFAAFDLTRNGCLGSWFSSLFLLAASAAAFLIYTIRRHRTDDYRGRYRIWLWAALCCFIAATDVAANLHESFRQTMIHLAKTGIWGDGTIWWIIPYILVFAVLGSRLVLDMRPCRLAIIAFLLAATCYLVAASMELGLLSMGNAVRAVMFKSGAAMYGHLMLLMSMALNARYVILDAEGLIPRQESKTNKNVIVKSSAAESKQWMRVDPPTGMPQPMLRTSSAASTSPSAAQPIFSKSPPTPASVTRKLTKQEKKALRDRLMRERLERQRRL